MNKKQWQHISEHVPVNVGKSFELKIIWTEQSDFGSYKTENDSTVKSHQRILLWYVP